MLVPRRKSKVEKRDWERLGSVRVKKFLKQIVKEDLPRKVTLDYRSEMHTGAHHAGVWETNITGGVNSLVKSLTGSLMNSCQISVLGRNEGGREW